MSNDIKVEMVTTPEKIQDLTDGVISLPKHIINKFSSMSILVGPNSTYDNTLCVYDMDTAKLHYIHKYQTQMQQSKVQIINSFVRACYAGYRTADETGPVVMRICSEINEYLNDVDGNGTRQGPSILHYFEDMMRTLSTTSSFTRVINPLMSIHVVRNETVKFTYLVDPRLYSEYDISNAYVSIYPKLFTRLYYESIIDCLEQERRRVLDQLDSDY